MPDLTISSTLRESMASIAQAICAVWEAGLDTPAVYAEHCRIHNADLQRSLIAHTPDGELVGIAILCRRGSRGFVLDFGIVPKLRDQKFGQRLFAALVDEMRQAGLREVTLMVSADNDPAMRIYERAGFQRTRELVALRGQMAAYAPGSAHELRDDIHTGIMAWFGAGKSAKPYWERELPSLLGMADARAFETARGFLLCRPSPYFRQVDIVHMGLDPAAEVEDVNSLLYAATVAYGPDLPLALPEEPRDSRACRLLHDLGFRGVDRSYEMRLVL